MDKQHDTMIIASRENDNKVRGVITYQTRKKSEDLFILEDSTMVDGIGGFTWEGALLLSYVMEQAGDMSDSTILELGCGSGLCGLVAFTACHATVFLTDRLPDLASKNANAVIGSNWKKLKVAPLSWGKEEHSHLDPCLQGVVADIIVGSEVACLRKQQAKLAETIELFSGPGTVVLISYDEQPPPNANSSEKEMDARMNAIGLRKSVIFTGEVRWHRSLSSSRRFHEKDKEKSSNNNKTEQAVLEDYTALFNNDLDCVAFPLLYPMGEDVGEYRSGRYRAASASKALVTLMDSTSEMQGTAKMSFAHLPMPCEATARPPAPPAPPADAKASSLSSSLHHIVAYYKPSAVATCSRCHKQFFKTNGLNNAQVVVPSDDPHSHGDWGFDDFKLLRFSEGKGGEEKEKMEENEEEQQWPHIQVTCSSEGAIRLPDSTTSSSSRSPVLICGCRYHSGFFVCRKHPAELRCSIDGAGDSLGYYGNGKEGWEAKFWDCCGSEDPSHPGCMLSPHLGY